MAIADITLRSLDAIVSGPWDLLTGGNMKSIFRFVIAGIAALILFTSFDLRAGEPCTDVAIAADVAQQDAILLRMIIKHVITGENPDIILAWMGEKRDSFYSKTNKRYEICGAKQADIAAGKNIPEIIINEDSLNDVKPDFSKIRDPRNAGFVIEIPNDGRDIVIAGIAFRRDNGVDPIVPMLTLKNSGAAKIILEDVKLSNVKDGVKVEGSGAVELHRVAIAGIGSATAGSVCLEIGAPNAIVEDSSIQNCEEGINVSADNTTIQSSDRCLAGLCATKIQSNAIGVHVMNNVKNTVIARSSVGFNNDSNPATPMRLDGIRYESQGHDPKFFEVVGHDIIFKGWDGSIEDGDTFMDIYYADRDGQAGEFVKRVEISTNADGSKRVGSLELPAKCQDLAVVFTYTIPGVGTTSISPQTIISDRLYIFAKFDETVAFVAAPFEISSTNGNSEPAGQPPSSGDDAQDDSAENGDSSAHSGNSMGGDGGVVDSGGELSGGMAMAAAAAVPKCSLTISDDLVPNIGSLLLPLASLLISFVAALAFRLVVARSQARARRRDGEIH